MEQCALRISETLSLRPDDVDPSGERLRVRAEEAKTGRSRWVPCAGWLLERLELPLPGSRQAVYCAVRDGCIDAGVHHFRPHDLRHRRASLWHQQGVPAVELARRLGHSRPSISLDVYSHVMPLDEIAAADLVRVLGGSSRELQPSAFVPRAAGGGEMPLGSVRSAGGE
jgi:integrase